MFILQVFAMVICATNCVSMYYDFVWHHHRSFEDGIKPANLHSDQIWTWKTHRISTSIRSPATTSGTTSQATALPKQRLKLTLYSARLPNRNILHHLLRLLQIRIRLLLSHNLPVSYVPPDQHLRGHHSPSPTHRRNHRRPPPM